MLYSLDLQQCKLRIATSLHLHPIPYTVLQYTSTISLSLFTAGRNSRWKRFVRFSLFLPTSLSLLRYVVDETTRRETICLSRRCRLVQLCSCDVHTVSQACGTRSSVTLPQNESCSQNWEKVKTLAFPFATQNIWLSTHLYRIIILITKHTVYTSAIVHTYDTYHRPESKRRVRLSQNIRWSGLYTGIVSCVL